MGNKSFFHDPIYGHIFLTEIERALVDTIEFQRLRFIRQNSLLHYVFPGAFHSRFSHSIGVCHNTQRLLQQLFPRVDNHQDHYCLQVVRIASLLHDVGHGAFSHMLPYVQVGGKSFLPSLKQVLNSGDRWNLGGEDDPIAQGIMDFFDSDMDQPIEHEALSVLILKKMFMDLAVGSGKHSPESFFIDISPQTWIQDVASMILYTIPTSHKFDESAKNLVDLSLADIAVTEDSQLKPNNIPANIKSILSTLVSGTIDADRMDYMLRDSRECGVNYGLYDYDGLISALLLVIDGPELVLGFNAKRVNTLDDFLWSRYQMFKQIYCHKTHSAYNLLLGRAMNDLAHHNKLSSPQSLSDYLKLTDDYVMSRVFEEAQTDARDTPWVKAFAQRELPKLLGVFEASISDPVWNSSEKEIYEQSQFEKYNGWSSDPDFVTVSLKAEVVRTLSDARTLPLAVRFDKTKKSYLKASYLNESVFFQSNLDENLRLDELSKRLNRKLLFFYKL